MSKLVKLLGCELYIGNHIDVHGNYSSYTYHLYVPRIYDHYVHKSIYNWIIPNEFNPFK